MRVIFFGSPPTALPALESLLKSGHSIELVVTQPDRPSGRGKRLTPCAVKEFALERNIPFYQPEKIRLDARAPEKIGFFRPDISVVVAYGQIIPLSLIDRPRYRSVNVHFSLLPKYRGASPVQWAILNGETTTGVTIFVLNEKMDEGDILTQEKVEIAPGEKARDLERRLAQTGAGLLVKTLQNFESLKPVPQDRSLATLAPKIRKEDGRISWTKNAELIDRQVRAFSGWPSAYTFIKEKRIIVAGGKPVAVGERPGGSKPGQVTSIRKEGIGVGCGGGSIFLIERLQPEGGKEMEAYAYSLGGEIKTGDFFR